MSQDINLSNESIVTSLNNKADVDFGNITNIIKQLTFSKDNLIINKNTSDSYIMICGDTVWTNGAALELSGMHRDAGIAGGFVLKTQSDEQRVELIGKPNGRLRWDNKPIVLYHGVTNDVIGIDSGNVSIASNSSTIITFHSPFLEPPKVTISHLGQDTNCYGIISNLTSSNFTIKHNYNEVVTFNYIACGKIL